MGTLTSWWTAPESTVRCFLLARDDILQGAVKARYGEAPTLDQMRAGLDAWWANEVNPVPSTLDAYVKAAGCGVPDAVAPIGGGGDTLALVWAWVQANPWMAATAGLAAFLLLFRRRR